MQIYRRRFGNTAPASLVGLRRNWKVIWWTERDDGTRRYVIGLLVADRAWKIFHTLRKRPHVQRIELWRGRKRIL